jgi:hypothetical protein
MFELAPATRLKPPKDRLHGEADAEAAEQNDPSEPEEEEVVAAPPHASSRRWSLGWTSGFRRGRACVRLETPIELASRLRLGREEFVQRLLTTLILDAPYPPWNSRSSVSEEGLMLLRSLWDLSELGLWPDADLVFVDEFELPGRHDDETGGAPDYAVMWPDRLWIIELKTEARSHRRGQIDLYFELARHHYRGLPIDLTYLTPPLRSTYEHDGHGGYAHVTWEQIAPRLAACWSHVERPDQVAVRDGLLDAIARLRSDTPGDYLASLRTQRPPEPVPRPDPVALGLELAAATADDREQRALEYAAASLEELQDVRKKLRDALADSPVSSPLLHVRPWIWTNMTDGRPLTVAGAETGAEVRFSRYREALYET